MRHPLLIIALGVVLGVTLTRGFLSPSWLIAGLGLGLSTLLLLWRSSRRFWVARCLHWCGWGLVLGVAYPPTVPLKPDPFRSQQSTFIEGHIVGPIRYYPDAGRLQLERVLFRTHEGSAQRLPGRLQLRVSPSDARRLFTGAHLRTWARLQTVRHTPNPGVRSFEEVLLARRVVARGYVRDGTPVFLLGGSPSIAHPVRSRFRAWLHTQSEQSGVQQAIALGDSGMVESQRREDWRAAGLAHLLAISGLHVGLFGWLVFHAAIWLLLRFPVVGPGVRIDRGAALLGIGACWAYVGLAGAPLSAMRAGWMLTGYLGARVLYRGPDATSALSLAALAVIVADPSAVLDPSCQLSFGAVTALSVGMSRRARAPEAAHGGAWSVLRRWFVASFLCTLGTLPIVVWHFQTVPLAGLLSNPVAIPMATWGLVIPTLGAFVMVTLGLADWAAPLYSLSEATVQMIDAIATGLIRWLPPLDLPGSTSMELLCLSGATVALLIGMSRASRRRLFFALSGLSVLLFVWLRVPPAGSDQLRVTFLAVGHGDATVLQFPNGATMLVDAGGPGDGAFDVGARIVVPALRALGVRRIDALVLSHAHPDHYGGMAAVANAFPIREFWWTGADGDIAAIRQLRQHPSVQDERILGQELADFSWGEARIRVLHPLNGPQPRDGPNDNSLVLQVAMGAFSLLLTGDVEARGERALLEQPQSLVSTLLKAPHHGSRTSSSEAFLSAVRPQLAVAQSADKGRYPFPHPEVEQRYEALGIPLWITGRQGALHVVTDGERWILRSWR